MAQLDRRLSALEGTRKYANIGEVLDYMDAFEPDEFLDPPHPALLEFPDSLPAEGNADAPI